jgi:predicted AlkP superfamily phosphohydrolase/phosphomutase
MKQSRSINRRDFISQSVKGLTAVWASSIAGSKLFSAPYILDKGTRKRVIVLGIDGMDPGLLKRFIQAGIMPTFQKFMNNNHFSQLQTTMPPQSPVAWSSFITGNNPGGHGIFDFIHRDPETFTPYFSTVRTSDTVKRLNIGKWSLPLERSEYKPMRHGRPFWKYLEESDIPATLVKLPVAFPVDDGKSHIITGMGTPDLLGTYGTFTLFSETNFQNAESFTGGRFVRVSPKGHYFCCTLNGPMNSLRKDELKMSVDVEVFRDPWEPVVKINLQGSEQLLKEGEWSPWIPVHFEMIPMVSRIHGMVRFYAKKIHPYLMLYVSPINVDPVKPEAPISSPKSYTEEICQDVDRFYTQGFPEDTKALSNGVFTSEEFLFQSKIVLDERLKMFSHELNRFREGLFFFYISSIDQNSHMLLRNMIPSHPLYEEKVSNDVKGAIRFFYTQMDRMLEQTLRKVDDRTTLMILSDHGFAPFTREFNLSTWLVNEGFTRVENPEKMESYNFYDGVDWKQTQAYVMGLNSIYINRFGRETQGSVYPRDVERIKGDIIARLQEVRDPLTGRRIVSRVFDSQKLFSGMQLDKAPDIVVGYQSGYRISDEAVLGKFPKPVIRNRLDKWSADHCMDFKVVPGVFLSNRQIILKNPAIWDIAPSILQEFGVTPSEPMDGKRMFSV